MLTITAYANHSATAVNYTARVHDMHTRPSTEWVIARGQVELYYGSTATEIARAVAEDLVRQCDKALADDASWTLDPAF